MYDQWKVIPPLEIFSEFNIDYIVCFYFLVVRKTRTILLQDLVSLFSQLSQVYKMVRI